MGKSELSVFLYQTRIAKNQTQEQAAEYCGVTRQTWIDWERGQMPSADKIQSLELWSGCAPGHLSCLAAKEPTKNERPWTVAGFVRRAGASDGMSYGELRSKAVALSDEDLREAIAQAIKSKLIERKGRGKMARFYPV